MYADFFGFRELPFNNTPDPRFFFATPDHEEGLASLIYAVKARKGFVLLTGEVGTGKTLVTRMMLRHFGAGLSFANISHSIQNPVEMMESICTEFELDCEPGESTTQLIRTLHDFLLGQFAQDIPVVLVLDEAQNLPVQAFEQLRMIGNLEADDAKLLQIAIVGQPELQRRFLSPKLRQLRQRIFRSYHLPALKRDVADQYIHHRLSVVTDANDEVFDDGALSEIYRVSKGLPRIINTVCDNALLSAYSVGRRHIDGSFVESVVSQMMILGEPSQEQRHAPLEAPSGGVTASRKIEVSSQVVGRKRPRATQTLSASPRTVSDVRRPVTAASPMVNPSLPVECAVSQQEESSSHGTAAAHDAHTLRDELAELNVSLEKRQRETSSQAARTEQLIAVVAEEYDKARALHDSLGAMVQTLTSATARAEVAARTIDHRDEQIGRVSETVSGLVRNLRSLLDRARETTSDVVTAERGARKTFGRLSDQMSNASRLVEKLVRLEDRISTSMRLAPSDRIQLGSSPPTPPPPVSAPSSESLKNYIVSTNDTPSVRNTSTPIEELLRNARASLSDLRLLAGTGRPTGYVPAPDIDRKAESTTRLADEVGNILDMIDPKDVVSAEPFAGIGN